MKRLFVDMDGTVTEYRKFRSESQYEQKGYYSSLRPIQPVVDALWIVHETSDIEIFIISACPVKGWAIEEKNAWLDQYLNFIDSKHRIFTYIGENKAEYIGDIDGETYLYDDYKMNLIDWMNHGGKAIKSLNGLNSEPPKNQYSAIAANNPSEVIAEKLIDVIVNGKIINDVRDEVYLRNESLGLTIIINRQELTRVVFEYFPEYESVEVFRSSFTQENWNFVRRLCKDAIVESNTSVKQLSFEFETFYASLQASLSKLVDAYKDFKSSEISYDIEKNMLLSKIKTVEEIENVRGNKRRRANLLKEFQTSLEHLEDTFEGEKNEWNNFKTTAINSINKQRKHFFEKYHTSMIRSDEEFEAACRHAEERVDLEVAAVMAAIV